MDRRCSFDSDVANDDGLRGQTSSIDLLPSLFQPCDVCGETRHCK